MDELIPSSMTIFVHLFIKKCHPKSYQSDTEYQMTLNIISCVVAALPAAGQNSSGGFEVRGSIAGTMRRLPPQEWNAQENACKDAAGPDLRRRCKPPPPVTLSPSMPGLYVCVCVYMCMYVCRWIQWTFGFIFISVFPPQARRSTPPHPMSCPLIAVITAFI